MPRTSILLAASLLLALPALSQPLPQLGENTPEPATAPATAPIAPPVWTRLNPPLQATVGGVTVRVVEAAWCRAEQLALEENYNPYVTPQRLGLAARIEIAAPLPPNVTARQFVRSATLEGSSGTLDSNLEAGATFGEGTNSVLAFWDGANPRWKSAQLRLLWRDPMASEESEGKFERTVTFDAPLPAQPDAPLEVEKKWTSPHGTAYTLRKILLRTQPKTVVQYDKSEFTYPPALYIVMQRTNPPRTPGSDATSWLEEQQPQVFAVDAAGHETRLESATESSGWLIEDSITLNEKPGWDSGNRTHFTNAKIPQGTRSLRLRFKATEQSDAWRDERALTRIQIPLDISKLKLPLPAPDAAWKPAAQTRGKYLEVALDEWREVEYSRTQRRLSAIFWTRDLERPSDAHRQWLLRDDTLSARVSTGNEPKVVLRAGQLFEARSDRGFSWPFNGAANWRPSTAALAGSELRRPFTFTSIAPGEAPKADTPKVPPAPFAAGMSLAGTWDEWLTSEHLWISDGLPIPKPGQVLELNRVLEHDGARVMLRKLAAFDATHGFPGVEATLSDGRPTPPGVLAVFEVLGRTFPGSDISPLDVVSNTRQEMSDAKGREIRSFTYGRGDATARKSPQGTDAAGKPQPDGREQWTTYFRQPAPDARTLSLRLLLTESKTTGRSETLELPNLPAPTPLEKEPR